MGHITMTLHGDESDHLPENQSTVDSDEVVVIPIGKAMFRCAIAAAIGSVPGVIVISLGGHRPGVMLVAFGLFIGAAIGLPGVSLTRVLKLFVAVLVSYNIPGVEKIYDWADESPSGQPQTVEGSMELFRWVFGVDIENPRRWLVLSGLCVGLLLGAVVHVRDVIAIREGRPGVMLPWDHSRDSLESQAVMGTLGFAIWIAVVTAIIGAPAFGRPLIAAIVFSSVWAAAIGYNAMQPSGPTPAEFTLFIASAAATTALLLLCIWHSPEEPEESNEPESQRRL